MSSPFDDEADESAVDPEEGSTESSLLASFLGITSSPIFRFAFRAAIPIAIVILLAIIVGAH